MKGNARSTTRNRLRLKAAGTLLVLMTCATTAQDLSTRYSAAPFAEREVLRYSVSWTFIHLGSVELRQSSLSDPADGRRRVQLTARSASGVPFVRMDIRDVSLLHPDDPRCTDFTVRRNHDPKERKHYRYDPATRRFSLKHTTEGAAPVFAERSESRRCFDALGFLMYVRGLAGSGEHAVVPMLMDFDFVDTRIICHREIEEIDVDAFEDDIPVHRITVLAGWEDETSGGMKGNYEIWCLAEPSSIPVYAEVDLAIGSIDIELESVTRAGWRLNAGTMQLRGGAGGNGGAR